MSDINITALQDEGRKIAQEIGALHPHTDVHLIMFEAGEKRAVINNTLGKLKNHPAKEDAASLLRFRSSQNERSGLLGVAEGYETAHFGLKRTRHSIAFIAMNLSDCRSQDDAVFQLYQITTHLLDVLSERKRRTSQPSDETKQNFIDVARYNLRADSLHILAKTRGDDTSTLDARTRVRALNVLEQITHMRPEEYPLPIAHDVIRYALQQRANKKFSSFRDDITLSAQIAGSFDVQSLRTWAHFVTPCQTLAWAGYTPEQILSAAIFLSPNPMIKATGHLLSEITGIQPCSKSEIPTGYNPFLEDEVNAIAHKRAIDETFEIAMIHTLEAESHLPLLRIANNQNEGLLKGHISGWCAGALQAAARAFEGARELGVPAAQAARLEFQTVNKNDGWLQLMQIANFIVDLGRNGTEARTLSGLAKWCSLSPEFKHIMNSINLTISDPHYSMKLRHDVEMPHVSMLAPATKISGPLPPQFSKSPELLPRIGLSTPGLGTTTTTVIPHTRHEDDDT